LARSVQFTAGGVNEELEASIRKTKDNVYGCGQCSQTGFILRILACSLLGDKLKKVVRGNAPPCSVQGSHLLLLMMITMMATM